MLVNNPRMQSETQTPSAQRPIEPEMIWTSQQVHRRQSCIYDQKESRMDAEPNSPFIRRSLLKSLDWSHGL